MKNKEENLVRRRW